MSFTAGTFYAFLECEGRQFLAAFPSRSHADAFWRIIQSLNNGYAQESRRFSAQIMSVSVMPDRLTVEGWDRRSCIVRAIEVESPLPVIPTVNQPDNINGAMFYIRSTLRPEYYWFFETRTRQIGVSKVQQSRFQVKRATRLHHQSREEEDILISADDVLLFVLLDESRGEKLKVVRDQGTGRLIAAQGTGSPNGSFKFWAFENGIQAVYTGEGGPLQAVGSSSGERWEFVA